MQIPATYKVPRVTKDGIQFSMLGLGGLFFHEKKLTNHRYGYPRISASLYKSFW